MSSDSGKVPAEVVVTDFSNMRRKDFPPDFAFGTATSAYQHEGGAAKGGRGKSIWDAFTLETPGRIVDGSNGNVTVDMYTRYEEDIKMMKSMGFDSYRFSISWPRILPGGRLSLGVNKGGVDFYNSVIDTLIQNGLEPYVTLFHWDLPQNLQQEYGGFLSPSIISDFKEYAELCFWVFGDRVKNWITLNEPWTYCVCGYVNYTFPPSTLSDLASSLDDIVDFKNIKSYSDLPTIKPGKNHIPHRGVEDFKLIFPLHKTYTDYNNRNPEKDPYTAARNLLLSHAAAVESYRTKFQGRQNGKIGITLVSCWFEPLVLSNLLGSSNRAAAKRALDFMLGWFLEPVLVGQYPDNMTNYVPEENLEPFSDEESGKLKGSIDFLGLNYYTAMYAYDDPDPDCNPGYYKDMQVAFTFFNGNLHRFIGKPAGSSWLYIVPWGIRKLLKYVNSSYNNSTYNLPPIYITENGVDEKSDYTLTAYEACRDKTRVSYHRDHLGYILMAINDVKVDVRGYFAWSWSDSFEWAEGYSVRFGLIYVDYINYNTRFPKDSAIAFSNFLNNPDGAFDC